MENMQTPQPPFILDLQNIILVGTVWSIQDPAGLEKLTQTGTGLIQKAI